MTKANSMKHFAFRVVICLAFSMFFFSMGSAQEVNKEILAESIEDFETGDFSKYDWQFEGDADWFITDVSPYEGIYSAQSGDIGDTQSEAIYLEYTVYAADILSFWYKVSSESNWDYLTFYVDGNLMDEWSGSIPWSYAEYNISAGAHTFKWEYSKDFSVSTGQDAAWIDMITFPPEEIEALFVADTTVICQGDIVFFTDLSIGPVTEWSWIFEGALPTTSTLQNPVVGYPNVGDWDVFLEVTDGIETAVYYQAEYIHVSATPSIANTPIGITNLCASWGNTAYNTVPMGAGVTSYDWILDPAEAGTISGNGGTNITVIWDPDFLGTIELMVAGINYCGIGEYSNPLTITRYLPEVTLILPAYVALPEPPFQLTGGTPPGGEYTGPGVSNGWFDPAAAGMGEHTITYTYTDVNWCTNSATDVITVTQFIGIDETSSGEEISIFPNPGNGSFIIQVNSGMEEQYSIRIYNTVNEVIYAEDGVLLGGGLQKKVDLTITNGLYLVNLAGAEKEFITKIIIRK
jgi:PKD repeat protein